MKIVAILLGAAMACNGIFMLVDPVNWYFAVPGVTSTGPFNQHFLRDIGLIFGLVGAAFITGAMRPAMRVALWGAGALWLTGHALFHVWEVAVGICAPSALLTTFPSVMLPSLIAIGLTIWAARTPPASRA